MIKFEVGGDGLYVNFGKNAFVNTINDWRQFSRKTKWNWYTMHFLHIYLENDKFTGGFEVVFVILGLGMRFRWNYDPSILEFFEKQVKKTLKSKRRKR